MLLKVAHAAAIQQQLRAHTSLSNASPLFSSSCPDVIGFWRERDGAPSIATKQAAVDRPRGRTKRQ